MAPIGMGLTQISAVAASSLVAAAWEGLLLAGVVAVCLRLLPGISAAARSVVWMAVLVVVAGLPFVHFGGSAAATGAQQMHVDERVGFALVGVWALLSVVRAAQLARSAVWLRGIARKSRPVETDATLAALLTSGPRQVRLCGSDEVDRPSVVGFFTPRILVPEALLERLAAGELEQIVLHEMEHLRRGDDWTNLVQKLSLVVFPLNPALIWIERQLCLERELACDDRVLRATGARKAYAACLANLAEHSLVRRGVSLALGAWERQSEVVRRVHRILARPQGQMGRGRLGFAVAVLLAGVAVGADGLAHAPELVSFAPSAHSSEVAAVVVGPPPSKVVHRTPAAPQTPVHAQNVVFHPAPPVAAAKAKRRVAVKMNRPMVETMDRASNTSRPELGQAAEDAPMVVMVSFRSVERSTGGVIVQDSQFIRYAAVPTRNGWLFVQL